MNRILTFRSLVMKADLISVANSLNDVIESQEDDEDALVFHYIPDVKKPPEGGFFTFAAAHPTKRQTGLLKSQSGRFA